MSALVTYEAGGDGTGRITFRRESVLNALNPAMVEGLWAALDAFHADGGSRVAVVVGSGRAFCVGADVHEMPAVKQPKPWQDLARLPEALMAREQAKPLIAAVHGYAIGAGLRLALLCDLAVCTETAQFRVPEIAHGLNAGWFWTLLQARAGDAFATEVVATGRAWSGAEAAARGVVTRSVPESRLLPEAQDLARQLASQPPAAIAALVETRRAALRRLELDAWVARGRELGWANPAPAASGGKS